MYMLHAILLEMESYGLMFFYSSEVMSDMFIGALHANARGWLSTAPCNHQPTEASGIAPAFPQNLWFSRGFIHIWDHSRGVLIYRGIGMGLYIFCLYRPEMPTGETLTRQLLSVIHVLQVAELVQQNLTVAAQDAGEISFWVAKTIWGWFTNRFTCVSHDAD